MQTFDHHTVTTYQAENKDLIGIFITKERFLQQMMKQDQKQKLWSKHAPSHLNLKMNGNKWIHWEQNSAKKLKMEQY